MHIRKAQKTDMPQVLELIQELAVFEKEPNAVEITVEDLIKDGFSNNPLFYCFVAEENNNILGIALYYYRYSTWKGKTIHLEDLIVKEDKRGLGIGFALYSEIIRQENSGPATGVKKGIKKAKGQYIIILDDDDMLTENSLTLRKNYIENNPEIDWFYGKAIWIDGNDLPVQARFQSSPVSDQQEDDGHQFCGFVRENAALRKSSA